jgi:decaprenylphospho-beta-D-erythro-pentofuranosid-2-ulose 2-reductase
MKNGLGVPQNIVLFGGTSDIGCEIVRRMIQPGVANIVLVSRDIDSAETRWNTLLGDESQVNVHHVRFDGADAGSMVDVVKGIVDEVGDIDVVVVAHALLGSDSDFLKDPVAAASVTTVNFGATMVLLLALGERMKQQGYGRICLLSSVAGMRVRWSNAVYGSTKAGIDGFALALDGELRRHGASLLVVRPGFVSTKMTAGMKKAPLATTPEAVASATVKAIGGNGTVLWTPSAFRFIFGVFRLLPESLWRRLPLG